MTVPVASFVAALTPIAREVGVTLPSPQAWTDRLAAIDGIDVDVVGDEATRLRSLADSVTGVTDVVGAVADELPTVWQGIAGQHAHSAVTDIHRSCAETGHRLRVAAGATAAAARGVTDLRTALHATLAAVPGLVLAGRAIAELTRLDLQANRTVVAALLQAAVTTVETALTVAESAITEVLTVLADGSGRLAEAPEVGASRTDVVHEPRPAVAATGVVGALAGAGAATAAAVGMAAVGAAGVVAHIVDTALDTPRDPDHLRPSPAVPSEVPRGEPPAGSRPQDDPVMGRAGTPDAPTVGPRPQLNLRYDDEQPAPTPPPGPVQPEPSPSELIPAEPPAPVDDDGEAPVTPPEKHDAPAVATRPGPAATPDPDDGGGLALAGDR